MKTHIRITDYGLGGSVSLSLSKPPANRTINIPENQHFEEIYAKVMNNFTENKCSDGLFLQVNKFKPTKNNNCETNINCRSPDRDNSNTSECLI